MTRGGTQEILGRSVPPRPLRNLTLFKTKDLIYEPDLFRFAHRHRQAIFQNNITEFSFLKKKKQNKTKQNKKNQKQTNKQNTTFLKNANC